MSTESMHPPYLKLCQKDELINPNGVCIVCGKEGLHLDCEKSFLEEEIEREKKFAEAKRIIKLEESMFLEKYSVIKDYGHSSKNAFKELDDIKKSIIRKFGDIHSFDETKIVENQNWWYIPYFYIGLTGYVYERHSSKIIPLGSAYGGHIEALKKYISGDLK